MTVSAETMIYIFVAGVAANGVWRLGGALLSSGISDDGAVITWVRAVSTALVAALISRIVLFPPGALADVDIVIRIAAFGLGILAFFLTRRNLGAGILAGAAALLAGHFLQL
jgi:hypothetical protein